MSMSLRGTLFLTAFLVGLAGNQSANAQHPCNQGYGAGYRAGFPQFPPTSYGPMEMPPAQPGYHSQNYYHPGMYQPMPNPGYQFGPNPGYQSNYGAPPVYQNFNAYPVNTNYGAPKQHHHDHDHDHHPWHLGHYLMGHH